MPAAAEVLDLVQIPAFLCRQTDLVRRLRPERPARQRQEGSVPGAVGHAERGGEAPAAEACEDVLLTERGASFGYNNLVVDFRGLRVMRSLGVPVVFDATHSVQLPGGQGTARGGSASTSSRWRAPLWPSAWTPCSWKCHEDPDRAPSDGPTMLALARLPRLLRELRAIEQTLAAILMTESIRARRRPEGRPAGARDRGRGGARPGGPAWTTGSSARSRSSRRAAAAWS